MLVKSPLFSDNKIPLQRPNLRSFFDQLSHDLRRTLLDRFEQACEPSPSDWATWFCHDQPIGVVPSHRAVWLAKQLGDCVGTDAGFNWQPTINTAHQRNEAITRVLELAHHQGLIDGWRDELFSFWSVSQISPDTKVTPFLALERTGFRFLGMLSHAVHINGLSADGHLWCGRRAANKTIDPSLLDNLAAGGVTSGEHLLSCAVRELNEEAGYRIVDPARMRYAGAVRISRAEEQLWHDEILHIYNLSLPGDFIPTNLDGEVSEFVLLDSDSLMNRLKAGECTDDSVLALAQGWRHSKNCQQLRGVKTT